MVNKGNKKLTLRNFPSISSVLEDERLKPLIEKWSFPFVSAETKRIAGGSKKRIARGMEVPSKDDLIAETGRYFAKIESDMLRPVINGTGVILHTNLGRAPLDPEIYEDLKDAVCGYSNLEFDIDENKRSKRGTVVGRLIAAVSGAEAGMIVNNNASSVYLIVANLAAGKEVVISRGQLVQIGGGFRIPEIIERSGAKLKEIGTTNKTAPGDYNRAINKNTGLILIVHKSNFVQKGFTEEPEPSKIVEIAGKKRIPVCFDLGSGLLSIDRQKSFSDEPDVQSAVRSGADLVCFSGDKLLGGPQAGLITGRQKMIDSLLKDPLYRVVRPDKLTIGLMEKTLLKYAGGKGNNFSRDLASKSVDDLEKRAERIVSEIKNPDVQPSAMRSSFGGGSLPDHDFASYGLKIGGDSAGLSRKLRDSTVPVIVRTTPSGILIDLRTVLPEQDNTLIAAIRSCLS